MPITVVCYALTHRRAPVAGAPNIRLIVLGGLYHPETASFSGPQGLDTLDRVGINTAFLSRCRLWIEMRGATCAHFHEVAVKQKAIATGPEEPAGASTIPRLGRVKPAFFAACRQLST